MFFAIFFAILSVTNSMKLTSRIHAAEEAYPNQFPYVVSLRLMKTFDGGRIDYNHFSGGGILNERWIISSAHQFHDEYRNSSNVFAFVGAHHFWRDGDKYGVRRIIIHPEFDWLWKTHDISLLKTSSLIIFADYVQPLPISTEFIDPGHEGVFAGWGETETHLTPFFLRYIELRVIPNDVCIEMHQSANRLLVHDTTLCTFIGYGAGTCNGDSGGVFVVNDKIVGVLSWGDPCAIGKPDQFTRVSAHLDFIRNNTKMEIH